MSLDKNTLVEALNDSVKDLHQGIDRHCCLVSAILADKFDERNLESFLDQFHSKSREILLRDAIKDAIETIEKSRKAFKSKQLELLRERFTQILIDPN